MVRCKIFDLRNGLDTLNSTVGMTQDLLMTGRRFFARSIPVPLRTECGADYFRTTCKDSHIWSDYAEPMVHLPQKVAYFAKEAPDYYESYAFAVKHGLGILEARHYRRRIAAADRVVQQSDTCEPILLPDCELTACGKLEHRLKQACAQYSVVLDQLSQEHAKAQTAEAAACQLAAQRIVSNAMNQAILHDQMASSNAAEADACRAAARMMVRSAFSKAIHEDEIATLQQQLRQQVEAEQAVATGLCHQLEEVQQAKQEAAQRHEAQMSAEKDQVIALKQQWLDLKHTKESMAQEHEQEAHSMREQLRQQEEAVHALKEELSTCQQEQQQSAEANKEVERELRTAREDLQAQLRQAASFQGHHHQGSHAPDMTTSPGSSAGIPATSNSAQNSSGPGSTDESWQSARSDHPCLDLASDKDEDGTTEDSMSGDDDEEDRGGALTSFLPDVIPRMPHDLGLIKASGVQVAQLASHQWHHRLLAILEHYHIPWKGSWDLVPLDFAPAVFALVAKSLSVIGQGSFGRVHFGQRWVGWGSPDSPQLGWAEGWEPVAIKIVTNSEHAQREVAALQRVQQALEQLPGSRHVIELLESHSHTTQPSGASKMYIVTRYEEGYDLDDSFKWLRQKWSEQVGSDRERGRAQWLLAVKEATRQAFQGLHVIHGCGLVHGDIKPNNFRMNMKPDGSQVHLVITDLGNCCADGSDHSCVVACAIYTSPEGLNYFKQPEKYLIQSAADIFSMGCVLYELLTDLPAFMRPEDQYDGGLTFDELHKLVLWRQAQWDTDSSRGRPLPYGLAALEASVPDDAECQQAVDLLQRMLKIEPSDRPSAQEALSHPFLQV